MAKKTVAIATLDKTFSKALRESYDYTCAFPNCTFCGNHSLRHADHDQVECAHYYNRYRASGRWCPDNCASLCHGQHMFLEHNKALEVKFFNELLGETRHDWLVYRHQGIFRYKPQERWEMNRHFAAQEKKIDKLRMAGEQGYIPLSAWD